MRVLLFILVIFAVGCAENTAEAQNGAWCIYKSGDSDGTPQCRYFAVGKLMVSITTIILIMVMAALIVAGIVWREVGDLYLRTTAAGKRREPMLHPVKPF